MLAIAVLGLSACGDDAGTSADNVAAEKQADAEQGMFTPGSPGVTFNVTYDIVGTPIIGSPLSIDLQIDSPLGDEAIEIGYQVPDASALIMEDTQPRLLTRAPQAGERFIRERVTVVPQREGRLFMNVRATRAGGDGSNTTVISIPIHVGSVDSGIVEHGELETNEEGETTRVLTSE